MAHVSKIISGGQTGADRGGLDAAIALGLPHGGYVPLGRRAEDGEVPALYSLEELPSPNYPARTAMNVKAAGGTLLFVWGKAAMARSRGTKLTLEFCLRYERPWWVADPRKDAHLERVAAWIEKIAPPEGLVLNIAGPRESRARGLQKQVTSFLVRLLGPSSARR